MKKKSFVLQKIKEYLSNKKFAIQRRIHPGIREQHRLDSLVGPRGYWNELQEYQLNFLKSKGMQSHHTLLDVGCGPLQGGIAFISFLDSNHYFGLDIRSESLVEAYKQVTRYDLIYKNPNLILSDTFGKIELNGQQFDFIWASQILYHLEPDTIHRFFEAVSLHLKPGAYLYGDIIGAPNKVVQDSHWNGFRFYLHSFSFMDDAAREHGLSMKHIGQIGDYGYPIAIALHTNDMFEFQKIRT
ncbi:MAG: class I SAM-dependent methyltransferase [Sedimentisphaerales bacterium]|nr:class I SAM-dependent methyltransferase [Sedimentisphaerales bacterium]